MRPSARGRAWVGCPRPAAARLRRRGRTRSAGRCSRSSLGRARLPWQWSHSRADLLCVENLESRRKKKGGRGEKHLFRRPWLGRSSDGAELRLLAGNVLGLIIDLADEKGDRPQHANLDGSVFSETAWRPDVVQDGGRPLALDNAVFQNKLSPEQAERCVEWYLAVAASFARAVPAQARRAWTRAWASGGMPPMRSHP